MWENIAYLAIGSALTAAYFYTTAQSQTRKLEACYTREFQYYGADGWRDAGEVPWVISFCNQREREFREPYPEGKDEGSGL